MGFGCSLLFLVVVLFFIAQTGMGQRYFLKISVPCVVVFLISTFGSIQIFFDTNISHTYLSAHVANISCWKNSYLPGDKLPELRLNTIRQISHERLKRRLSNIEYNTYKALLAGVVKIFSQFNIRYTM